MSAHALALWLMAHRAEAMICVAAFFQAIAGVSMLATARANQRLEALRAARDDARTRANPP